MLPRSLALAVLTVLCLPAALLAWGSKEHILLTRLAMMRLVADPTTPAGLKNWVQTADTEMGDMAAARTYFMTARIGIDTSKQIGMPYWVTLPDARAGDRQTIIAPFNLPERPLHFIDLEYLSKEPDKRVYRHDLSNLPDITKASRDVKDPNYKEAGALPFAVDECYRQLVASFKAGRLLPSKAGDEDHALKWAGYLAHYVEDNTQPQHATQDYQSRTYFADRRSAPNVHAEMEYKMNDDEKNDFPQLRADYWAALTKQLDEAREPETDRNDLWLATLQIAAFSYANLPLIGEAAMSAAGQGGTPEKPEGKAGPVDTEKFFRFEGKSVSGGRTSVLEMKARQQAIAVHRVQRLFRAAWDAAHAGQ
ncbi:MAG TPA: hypothetical protein VF624_13655 [Tepidisphaeraceae bacterium]|jgi:hypothetical protein